MLFFLLGKNADEMLGFEQPWDCVMGAMHLGRQNSKFEEGWLLHDCGATNTTLDCCSLDFVEAPLPSQTHTCAEQDKTCLP